MPPDGTERIAFTVGRRSLLAIELKLAKLSFTLEHILEGGMPACPDVTQSDGVRLRSVPVDRLAEVLANYPGLMPGMVHRFGRRYIRMNGSFEDYLAGLSRKTRSTLRRKRRRFTDAGGGTFDFREYRGVEAVEEFIRLALPLSNRTYQARLLKKGLPGDAASRQGILALAAEDRVRAFMLFLHGAPAAYLYLPVSGRTLIYHRLGYEPRLAALSPGTVLQFAALERLFAEGTFAYFDFTDGGGQHKEVYATGSIPCESLVLLKPSLANRARLAAHENFSRTVRGTKALARGLRVEPMLRNLIGA